MDLKTEMEKIYAKAKEMTTELIGQEQDDAIEKVYDIEGALDHFNRWKKMYCRSNRPKSYIRLRCRLPQDISIEYTAAWMIRLQIFTNNQLLEDIRISYAAYVVIKERNLGWRMFEEHGGVTKYIYRHPNFQD